MRLRLAVLLLAVTVSAIPLGLCTSAAGNKEVINGIEYDYSVSGSINAHISGGQDDKTVAEFRKAYPNIKVNVVNWEGSWVEWWNKYVVLMKAGGQNAPDVIRIESQQISKHSTYLENLLKPPYNAGRMRLHYNSWIWRVMTNGRGEVTMLQGDICTTCTWYRPDLLEMAGLPTDPKAVAKLISTPAGLLEAAEKLMAKGYYILDDQIWTYQGALGLRMATKDWKPVWTDAKYRKKFAKVLTLYRDFKLRGLLGPNQWDYNNIKQNKYAMLPGCTWSWFWPIKDAYGDQANGKWRVTDPILASYGTWGGSGSAISRTCKDKAAAWEFVKFTNTHPKAWVEDWWLSIPALKGLWKLPFFQENLPEFKNSGQDVWQELFRITAVNHDGPANATPIDSAVNGAYFSMLEDYLKNGGDVQAVMTKWAEKAVADVEAFRKKEGVENAIEWTKDVEETATK